MASGAFPEQGLFVLALLVLVQNVLMLPGALKQAIKPPEEGAPLARAHLGTLVSKMACSFLPTPQGMAGLRKPSLG